MRLFYLVVLITVIVLIVCIVEYIRSRQYMREVTKIIHENADFEKYVGESKNKQDEIKQFIRYSNEIVGQRYEMRLMQQDAELRALQNQINPHFLYNTLDTIRGKAYEEKAYQSAEMIELLAQMFRYTIGQKESLVTVEEEIANVETYIAIQQYRFNKGYGYEKKIEDASVLQQRIPRLTLQPLVENAIRYGLRNSQRNTLRIGVFCTQNKNVISVYDNGSGMDEEQLLTVQDKLRSSDAIETDGIHRTGTDLDQLRSTGIALINVNSRIKLKFGEEYGLQVHSTKGIGTEVLIYLPKES